MSENAEVKSPRIDGRDNTGVPVLRLGRRAVGLTALGLACFGSTAGCGGDTAVVDVASIPTTVTVTPGQVHMTAIGDTVRLSVEIQDQYGGVIEAPVQWTSGDPTVAVVDDGLVRAAGNGETSITATVGSASGSAAVTVAQEVSAVAVSPAADTLLAFGDTVRLVAEATDANGHAVAVSEFSWASSDTLVARVDASGQVTAAANGRATITATAGSASGSAAVTVAQEVSAVAVSPAADTLLAFGDTVRLVAEATDANGHAVAASEFSWASSDTLVARVDASGQVTAAANGSATITATAGSASGSAAVTVAQEVSAVAVSPAADTLLAFGDTVRLVAEATDANGHAVAASEFSWASSDTLVARVDASGQVTAAANGSATITATAGSASGSAAVTVAQEVSTVDVSPDRSLLDVGATVRLSADVRDANGHAVEDAAVSWTSSDLSVARVDAAGLVTALAMGEAVVVASSDAERDSVNIMVFGRRGEAALAALYLAADGPNWTNSHGWLSEAPLGEWYGVETDAEGRVANLDLNGNQLRGTIVAQLGDLDRLEYLDLGFNGLTGVIPAELGAGLSGLTRLYLNENGLSGPVPAELGDLSDLVHLDLGYNELTGTIPAQLGNLRNVTRLALNHNELSGPVPAELGNLSDLSLLGLGSNQLTGPIPEEIASLEHLEVLSLSGNDLSGTIPASLGGMDELRSLRLDGNQLTGPIPSELGGLETLVRLDVSSNALTGPIPGAFGDLASLEYLALSFNDLTDSIPVQLGGLTELVQVYLDDNDLSGTVPSQLRGLVRLRILVLDNNARLQGALPLELTSLTELRVLTAVGTDICAPSDPAFVRWMGTIRLVRVAACGS